MTKISKTLQNLKVPNIEKYVHGLNPVIDFSENMIDTLGELKNVNNVRNNVKDKLDDINENVDDYLYENIPGFVKKAINDKFPELTEKCKCFKFLKVLPKLSYKLDIDLRTQCPRIYDQGSMGSCTANSGCLFYSMISHQPNFEGSRLFLYYNSREREGHVKDDKGAVVHTAIACLRDSGVCPESQWGYDSNKIYDKPGDHLYKQGLGNKIKTAKYLNRNRVDLLNCLESGKPFLFGFNLGKGFMKRVGKSGTFFKQHDKEFLGSHCVCCVGYSKEANAFLVANSWGDRWGFKGYFLISEKMIMDPKVTGMFFTAEM
jgi:C1A family cysteine protease